MDKCCGNCKFWKQFKGKPYGLQIGDCEKIAKGTNWKDGDNTYTYDGYSFEDEYYGDIFGCYEPKEK